MLRSTVSVETPEGISLQLPVAGLVVRAIAWTIDFFARMVIYGFLSLLVGYLGFFHFFEQFIGNNNDSFAYVAGISSIIFFLLEWFFTTIPEALYGTTPGKKVMGLRVTHIDGTPISWQSSVLRNFLRFADFLPLMYFSGVVSMLIDGRARRLGDLAAGTMVVYNDTRQKSVDESAEQFGFRPTFALLPGERSAVIEFDERCDALTEERQIELAALLGDLDIGEGMQSVSTLRAWARWYRSGNTEVASEHASAT